MPRKRFHSILPPPELWALISFPALAACGHRCSRAYSLHRNVLRDIVDHGYLPIVDRRQRLAVGTGELWQDNEIVFATKFGTEMNAANVRPGFGRICGLPGSTRMTGHP